MYTIAGFIGISLVVLLILAYFASWIIQYGYAWVTDSKVGVRNAVTKFIIVKMFGYTTSDHDTFYYNRNNRWADGSGPVALTAFMLLMLPTVLLAAFQFASVTISLVAVIALLHLTRFCVKQKKLLNKHLKEDH